MPDDVDEQSRPGVASTRILFEILDHHRALAAALGRDDVRRVATLAEQRAELDPPRPFAASLRRAPNSGVEGLRVIAEIKRRSPSKGSLAAGLDPSEVAESYTAGGAAALSVLTDEKYFGGSIDDLQAARGAVEVPVLRKDFTVARSDVDLAAAIGADAVLLIVAGLTDPELLDLHTRASDLGLGVLVEVFDEAELDRAWAIQPDVIGVNQRDLRDFSVDPERAARMAPLMKDVVRVAESGISGHRDAEALAAAGFDALLVGEHLVTAADPRRGVYELLHGPVGR